METGNQLSDLEQAYVKHNAEITKVWLTYKKAEDVGLADEITKEVLADLIRSANGLVRALKECKDKYE